MVMMVVVVTVVSMTTTMMMMMIMMIIIIIIIIIIITASAVPEDSLKESNDERVRYIGISVHRYNSIYMHELSQQICSLRSVPEAQAAHCILPATSPLSAL